TGRAGKSGTAITIVAPIDGKAVAAIEKLTGQAIPSMGAPAGSIEEPPRQQERAERPEPREQPRRERQQPRRQRERPPRHQATNKNSRAARPRRQPEPVEDGDTSHLPAFLLRPVQLKA